MCDATTNRGTAVLFSISDHRPSVVFARFHNIHFITTQRAKFGSPQDIINPVHRQPLHIAVTIRVNRFHRTIGVQERISSSRCTVFFDPQDLAQVTAQFLSLRAGNQVRALTGTQQQIALVIEKHTAAKV
ncbi:hypothetical protein D3C72_1427480 [compost metagenome]